MPGLKRRKVETGVSEYSGEVSTKRTLCKPARCLLSIDLLVTSHRPIIRLVEQWAASGSDADIFKMMRAALAEEHWHEKLLYLCCYGARL